MFESITKNFIGLAAALALVALAPAAVMSQSRDAGVTEKARTQGMAEAPAVVAAAGLNCQVVDARLIGKNENRRAKTSTSYYEVDCQEGMGFAIEAVAGGATSAYTCLEASAPTEDGKPSALACQLPGNQNPQAELAKLDTRIKTLGGDIDALKKQGNPAQSIRSLEQDLLVLRSELDNRPAASAGPNTAEFDAFRAQMTRNINTLQSQVVNLQQQINQR